MLPGYLPPLLTNSTPSVTYLQCSFDQITSNLPSDRFRDCCNERAMLSCEIYGTFSFLYLFLMIPLSVYLLKARTGKKYEFYNIILHTMINLDILGKLSSP
jgi:hypothetical protein